MPVYGIHQKRIDWTKPNLRLVYLIEGFCRNRHGIDPEVVRWCGPASRAGSGFGAHPTFPSPGSYAPGPGDPLHPVVAWEPRLSRCSFDWTLGSLKQHIQPLSEVSVRVDLGDSDLTGLRERAIRGRWRGHQARLVLVDADELERFEILADGTWDKDPEGVGLSSFKMTIDVGELLPPTLRWPMYQVPRTTSGFQVFSYASTIFSPDDFSLNPNQKGKWLGQVFGGAVHASHIGDEVWRELVPYGSVGSYDFALVSPRFDQFCYDIVVETDDGLVKISANSSRLIRVFNNNDPLRGPVGTCVKFAHVSGFAWASDQRRAWGKVAGGVPLHRPSGYSNISYSGNPTLGTNQPGGGEATPSNTTEPQAIDSEILQVIKDVFGGDHFLGAPGELHPDTLPDLAALQPPWGPLPNFVRMGAVPNEIVGKKLYYRQVLEPLMQSIPADLVMRWDDVARRRKFYVQVRQFPTDTARHVFALEDLADADRPGVVQSSDPDGYYSNETTVTTADYYVEPLWDTDEQELEVAQADVMELVDIFEQGDHGVGQVVEGEVELSEWRFLADHFPGWARVVEETKSQPQRVLTAVHGYPSMRLELGAIVAYNIPGVLSDPGQIRGLRFDLDKQRVTVRTYHRPVHTKASEVDSTIKDKDVVTAEGRTPERDRRE